MEIFLSDHLITCFDYLKNLLINKKNFQGGHIFDIKTEKSNVKYKTTRLRF